MPRRNSGLVTGGHVVAVARAAGHGFAKGVVPAITLVAGHGVEGDAHAGATVRHRSRVAIDPRQPNLRQVHLLRAELLNDLAAEGFAIAPGQVGENILTRGLDLLRLPTGTRLQLGPTAIVEITGLRNPCAQLDRFQRGLTKAMIGHGPDGAIIRKAGVMAIVIAGGVVAAGDTITVTLPPLPHAALAPV
jgi:MOSC domain-containing protein YiiM